MSGNEAIARAVWDAGVRVAAAYPGTPSTEILENVARYPDIYAEWSVNEKVSLEVAIGASTTGARSFCAMKHVGLNVAADALMTLTLTGVVGGLVIAVADDVGFSSSQNEQDSRFWGRFAHLPIIEPADSQEAYDMAVAAFALSEKFNTPVILRLTTRICHVKCLVNIGSREAKRATEGFQKNPSRWVMVPANAQKRVPEVFAREKALAAESESSAFNRLEPGKDKRVGFVTSGPAYMHVRETFPDAPILKLGISYPVPMDKVRELAAQTETLIVVEETEQLLETEIRAAGIPARGKDLLPAAGELPPYILRKHLAPLFPEFNAQAADTLPAPLPVFPRPPTMCVACPHLGVYYTLSQLRNIIIAGDIGCYTLGAGHPWNALDTTICMGASMGMALGMDKGRGPEDEKKNIVAVIGDSTFMHMGMQGLLDIAYNGGNVTVLLLDNRTVGMTGGQDNPASGRDIHGEPAPRIDFAKVVESLGIPPEHVRVVDPYLLPVLFKTLREEIKHHGPSVIITNRPCVLIDEYAQQPAFEVIESACTGCGNCIEIGCPAIHVTRREKAVKPSGKEVELAFASIETAACTGCGLCLQPCAPNAIKPAKIKGVKVEFV
ncbi:MAG: 4Fe-4S dicluster domain-containing protein [Azoarcus sp.]|jgi:indolepyruvate ferredoxin oxidoreductase alpha subunit|nr:4Fe-4S dicluster domain-containing protein [Azoarcus sp.]